MRSEPVCLGEISLDFAEIPTMPVVKIFHRNTRKWASPERRDRVFLIKFCFVFQMLKIKKKYKKICSA